MSRSCCAAPLLFSKRMDASTIATAPPWNYGNTNPETPSASSANYGALSDQTSQDYRARRDLLAAAAKTRYEGWASANSESLGSTLRELGGNVELPHQSMYVTRSRDKDRELAGDWVGANKVKTMRERVHDEVQAAAERLQTRPLYPQNGPPMRNLRFSYTYGYDLRQRQPSKEISGTSPILVTRPRTEGSRINMCASDASLRDALGGSKWSVDNKYGNPVVKHFDSRRRSIPLAASSPHRSSPDPDRWLKRSPSGFESTFPSTTPRSPTREAWRDRYVHHPTEFVDKPHVSTEASIQAHRQGTVPGFNILSGRGSPTHLTPTEKKRREQGFNPVTPGQSLRWSRPPATGGGEVYIPVHSPRTAMDRSLRSTGQLPPSPVPEKTYYRSTSSVASMRASTAQVSSRAYRAF